MEQVFLREIKKSSKTWLFNIIYDEYDVGELEVKGGTQMNTA